MYHRVVHWFNLGLDERHHGNDLLRGGTCSAGAGQVRRLNVRGFRVPTLKPFFMLASSPCRCTIQKQMIDPLSQPKTPAADTGEVTGEPQLHDLVPFVAGDRVFAVFADQVEGTAEARVPAALPNAPPAVLG